MSISIKCFKQILLDGERQVTAQYKHTKFGAYVNIMLKIAIAWETV